MTKQERRTQILELVQQNGVDLVSTRSLADTFAVSEITIRRDLQDLADEGLIQRQHGGVSAPRVPTTPPRHIGILLVSQHGKFSHPFFNEILEGADSKLQSLGYYPAFVKTFAEVDSEEAVRDLLELHPVEGLLLIGELNAERLARWQTQIPHIVSTPTQLSADTDVVLFDSRNGIEQLFEHLLRLGYKRPGFIVSRSVLGRTDLRLETYRAEIKRRGLDSNSQLVFEKAHALELVPGEIGRTGAAQLMSLPKPPDVLMCSSDMIALGAMQWLQAEGYRIPEDVVVTGFDNIPEAARTFPPLTTVHVHKQMMGALAAEMLHRRLENPGDPALRIITPTYLVVRQSCGAVKQLAF